MDPHGLLEEGVELVQHVTGSIIFLEGVHHHLTRMRCCNICAGGVRKQPQVIQHFLFFMKAKSSLQACP